MPISITVLDSKGALKCWADVEKEWLEIAIRTGRPLTQLATDLKIGRTTLYKKMREYRIHRAIPWEESDM